MWDIILQNMKLVIVRSLGLLILEEGPPGMRVGGQLSMKKEKIPRNICVLHKWNVDNLVITR